MNSRQVLPDLRHSLKKDPKERTSQCQRILGKPVIVLSVDYQLHEESGQAGDRAGQHSCRAPQRTEHTDKSSKTLKTANSAMIS